ncbi:ThiF family adenylyltransferase [Rhodococcus sp. 3Y1]
MSATPVVLPPLVEPASQLSREEAARYSRHLIILNIGMTGQKRLKNARVLFIGAGGLGSPALLYPRPQEWAPSGSPSSTRSTCRTCSVR